MDGLRMTKSTAERQRAYKARKQAQGLVRVAEWVHKDDAAMMRNLARQSRKSREGRSDFIEWLATTAQDK